MKKKDKTDTQSFHELFKEVYGDKVADLIANNSPSLPVLKRLIETTQERAERLRKEQFKKEIDNKIEDLLK